MFVDVVDGAGWAATVSSQEKRKGSEEQKPNRALPPIRVTTFRLPPSLKKESFFPVTVFIDSARLSRAAASSRAESIEEPAYASTVTKQDYTSDPARSRREPGREHEGDGATAIIWQSAI